MDLYDRLLIEREIAPVPLRGEDPILMQISQEIAEGKRAMPATPVPSTYTKSMRAAILKKMKAEVCE